MSRVVLKALFHSFFNIVEPKTPDILLKKCADFREVQICSCPHKLMAATKISDYSGLKHYKKAKKLKHFIHLALAYWPQSLSTYHSISPTLNSGHRLKKHVPVM